MEANKWTDLQYEYISFFARGLKTIGGEKISRDEWGKRNETDPATLWRWQQLPGFKQVVFDLAVAEFIPRIPDMLTAQVAKATGQQLKDSKGKVVKPGDTQAFMALMRQFELLKSDKLDHTTNGKDMPSPIISLIPDVQ